MFASKLVFAGALISACVSGAFAGLWDVRGTAIKEAVGNKKGIRRYGSCMLPIDEVLVPCAVDLSGRPYMVYDADFKAPSCDDMDTQMAREFFYAISYTAGMNLHIKVFYGENDHHIMEACNTPPVDGRVRFAIRDSTCMKNRLRLFNSLAPRS